VGAASSMAQVYSQNAVGYINVTVKPGFNLVGNQLIQANVTIASLLPAPPAGTIFYSYSNGFSTTTYDPDLGGWDPDPNLPLPYGGGGFLFNPTASNFTLTLVGDVGQGSLANAVPAGFAIRASKVPQAGRISTDLGFPAVQNDTLFQYVNPSGYSTYTYDVDLGGWDPAEPTIAVGEGFFIQSTAGHAWTRTFSVN
jgi:hypothetical protein